jgi:hypothetical protein
MKNIKNSNQQRIVNNSCLHTSVYLQCQDELWAVVKLNSCIVCSPAQKYYLFQLTPHTLLTTHNSIVQLTECTAGQTRT